MRSLMCKVLFYTILVLPTALFGFFREGRQKEHDFSIPPQLIVKIRADLKPHLSRTDEGIIKVGLESFDNVNKRYGVVKQEYLLPQSLNSRRPDPLRNIFIISIPDGTNIDELISEYEKLNAVEYALADMPVELYEVPNDPLYSHQWSLNNEGQGYYHVLRRDGNFNDTLIIEYGNIDADIDALEVYENPPDVTAAAVVAIVDTGIDTDHPDLTGRIWLNSGEIPDNGFDDDHNGYVDDNIGWDFGGNVDSDEFPPPADNDPTDEYGHGTHCAGIIAAVTNNLEGVAGINGDSCQIMALDFWPLMLLSDAAEAIVYAADNGADVINMSWGLPYPIAPVEDALQYARAKDVILIASSGNDGIEYYNYPASYEGVITVGASTSRDEKAEFSTYSDSLNICGPGQSILSLRADTTDMYAPNEPNVHVIDSIYYLASGTSMSGPCVAGVAAYIRASSPGLHPDSIKNIIESTADDMIDPLGTGEEFPGWDIYSAHGRVNLNNALAVVPELRARIDLPQRNQIISGIVQVNGSAGGQDFTGYVLEYGQGSLPTSWTEITNSTTPVTYGQLGEWITPEIDGVYTLRLKVNESNIAFTTVFVANNSIAEITSPQVGDSLSNSFDIIGTAVCPNFGFYTLEFGPGTSPESWEEISTSAVPVKDGELVSWLIETELSGEYTIRLSVFSEEATVEAVYSVTVFIETTFSSGDAWMLDLDSIAIIPNYGDFDNDGFKEIVVGTTHGIKFFNPDGSPKMTGIPEIPEYDCMVPVAVGELDGDGIDDFVAVCMDSAEVTRIMGFPSSQPEFEVETGYDPIYFAYSGQPYQYPTISLKDINADGKDEIIYTKGWYSGHVAKYQIFNPDGSFRYTISIPTSAFAAFQSADLDGDGIDEFYIAQNVIYQYDTTAATRVDSFDLRMGVAPYIETIDMSAADIDGDGKHELIVMGKSMIQDGSWAYYAFDEGLNLKGGWPRETGIDVHRRCPTFFDIDLDGEMEYFATANEHIMAWNIDGTPYGDDTTTPIFITTPQPSRLTQFIAIDINFDFFPEIVACSRPDRWYVYDLEQLMAWDKNGNMLSGWPIVLSTETYESAIKERTPITTDINNDGNIDILKTTINNDLFCINFNDCPYDSFSSPIPFYRYNQRLNNASIIFDIEPLCGDADGNQSINLLDITRLIAYLYMDGPEPVFPDMADVNGDYSINILDITYLIAYLYKDGPEPVCQS